MTSPPAKWKGPPPIDRGWAWMITLGFFLNCFMIMGVAKSYGLIFVALIRELHITATQGSTTLSVIYLVSAVSAPISIMIAARVSIKPVVVVGALIAFVGVAASSLLYNIAFFAATFGVGFGLNIACFYGNGLIMLNSYFRERRTLANGLGLCGASLGQLTLPLLVEYLLKNYGLSGTLLVESALLLNGCVTGFLFRPIEKYDTGIPVSDNEVSGIEKHSGVEQSNIEEDGGKIHDECQMQLLTEENADGAKFCDGDFKQIIAKNDNNDNNDDNEGDGKDKASSQNIITTNHNEKEEDQTALIEMQSVSPTDKTSKNLEKGKLEFNFESNNNNNNNNNDEIGAGVGNDEDNLLEKEKEKEKQVKKLYMGSQGSIFMSAWSISPQDHNNIEDNLHLENSKQSSHKNVSSDKNSQNTNSNKCVGWLNKILDVLSVLKNYVSILYTASVALSFFGYFNFIMFLPGLVTERGIEDYDKAMLLSICGLGDLIARVGTGFVGDLNILPRYVIMMIACVLCALSIFAISATHDFALLAIECAAYGCTGGTFVCLTAVVMVDFVGYKVITQNMALIFFIQGIVSAAGYPFMGMLRDSTGSYTMVCVVCGVGLLCGASVLLFYPLVRRLQERKTR